MYLTSEPRHSQYTHDRKIDGEGAETLKLINTLVHGEAVMSVMLRSLTIWFCRHHFLISISFDVYIEYAD